MAGSCYGPVTSRNLVSKCFSRQHNRDSISFRHLVRHFRTVHNVACDIRQRIYSYSMWCSSLSECQCCTQTETLSRPTLTDVNVSEEVGSLSTKGLRSGNRPQSQMIIGLGKIVSHLWAGDLHVIQSIGYTNQCLNLASQRSISMSARKSPTHYYDVLGLNPNATQSQIKAAYYKLSKQHHPDITQCSKSHSLFTEIREAYDILGNLRKRRMYDRGVFNPRDTRGDTVVDEEEKDYTQAYKKSSKFERGSKPPPPTGRSTIYNFDEFYRQHYNEIRERRSTEFKEYVKYQEGMNKGENHNSPFNPPVFLVFVTLFLALNIAMLLEKNYDRDHVSPKTPDSKPDYLPNGVSATVDGGK